MKLAIIGQSWLAQEVLEAMLATEGVEVVAAAPEVGGDRFEAAALAAGVPVVPPEALPPADVLLAAHCNLYLGEKIRGRFRLGVLAYHPSLLPRHRGRDSIYWTIAFGDPIAGGTVFWMDGGVDTGPVEEQKWCFVAPGDTPLTLWKRELGPLGVRLLLSAIMRLSQGKEPRRQQQQENFATYEPPVSHAGVGGKKRPKKGQNAAGGA